LITFGKKFAQNEMKKYYDFGFSMRAIFPYLSPNNFLRISRIGYPSGAIIGVVTFVVIFVVYG